SAERSGDFLHPIQVALPNWLWKQRIFRFAAFCGAWDTEISRANMNLSKTIAFVFSTLIASSAAFAQDPAPRAPAPTERAPQEPPASATSSRAEAYFAYTMGHIAEQQYEATSRSEYATQAIDYYKKAYALDPKSPVIGERLAEMYWKAQPVHEPEIEAPALLNPHPNHHQ